MLLDVVLVVIPVFALTSAVSYALRVTDTHTFAEHQSDLIRDVLVVDAGIAASQPTYRSPS